MTLRKIKTAALYLLAFIIPAILILAALTGMIITPFGDNSLVLSDGDGLYINFLGYVGRTVKGQEGFLFSFEKGLGGNMMSSWGWFLLNPLFALFGLADITNYMQAYTWVSLLNFCVCGVTMYILLKDLYGHRVSNLIFSTAYALNGFLVANVFQMNFFACIPVLPLMVLGLRWILSNRNPLLYILSLAYSLLMNFYFGFMLCAASFLIFIVFFLADREQIADRKSVAIKYSLSSLLAGALSSVVWLPAILSLRGGRLDQSIAYAITMRENMPFLDIFSKLFTGANTTAELRNGLPNIFVGILPVFLVILFFMNRKIAMQQKITAAVLLVLYLLSFYIAVFNIVMHGGTVTNWFNYRDSFVFCFLMLMVAAEEWQYLTDELSVNLKKAVIILILATLIVFSKSYEFVTGTAVLIDFAILALMLLALWMHRQDSERNTKEVFTLVALLLMCVNLFLNYYISTKNLEMWEKKESDYQETVTPVSALIDAVHNHDGTFYRMEIGEQRSGNVGNDPMLYGYYGVGHGGSDDRDFVRLALSELGVRRYNMRNSYGQGITAATDTLLGLKYIISKDNLAEEKGYEKLVDIGQWALYRNPHVLPIAVVTDGPLADVSLDLEDIFENLNRTWSAMTGNPAPIFAEENNITFISHNITDPMNLPQAEAVSIVSSRDVKAFGTSTNNGSSVKMDNSPEASENDIKKMKRGTFREKPENTNYIQFTWTASRDGAIYTYNRSAMTENDGSILPALNYEGFYHAGDTVTGYIPVTDTLVTEYLLEEVAGRFRAAYADDAVLAEMSQTILSRPSTVERIKDSHLRGEFTAEAGQLLMFTIPYDEGWTLTVDGKESEIKQVLGIFMAAEVEPGTHTYEMKFFPSGMRTGIIISAAALAVTVIFVTADSISRRKRNRAETVIPNEAPAADFSEQDNQTE